MSLFTRKPKNPADDISVVSNLPGDVMKDLREIGAMNDRDEFRSSIWKNSNRISEYLKGFKLDNADLDYTANYVNDALPRFLHTLDFIPLSDNLEILELGANPYLFSILARHLFPHSFTFANFFAENVYETQIEDFKQSIANVATDEHYEFHSKLFNLEKTSPYPYEDETFDIIICCEILEHLVLNPFNLFTESKRILKPGGKLIITTPNAVRLTNVAAMLAGENIFDMFHHVVHGRHNREYTVAELKTIANDYGYTVDQIECRDRFDYNVIDMYSVAYNGIVKMEYNRDSLNELLYREGKPLENRGDNIYLVAVKN